MKFFLLLIMILSLSTAQAENGCPSNQKCYFLKVYTYIKSTGFVSESNESCPQADESANLEINLKNDNGITISQAFSPTFKRYQQNRFLHSVFKIKPLTQINAHFCAPQLTGAIEINVKALTLPPACINTTNEILTKVQECQIKHDVLEAHLQPTSGVKRFEMNQRCKKARETFSDYVTEFRRKASTLDDLTAMIAITIDPLYEGIRKRTDEVCDPNYALVQCQGNCLED